MGTEAPAAWIYLDPCCTSLQSSSAKSRTPGASWTPDIAEERMEEVARVVDEAVPFLGLAWLRSVDVRAKYSPENSQKRSETRLNLDRPVRS